MQKLNKIFLFVLLSFCLLVNVSYCALDSKGQASWKVVPSDSGSTTNYNITSNYTLSDIWVTTKNYYEGTYSETIYKTMCDDLKSNGFGFIASYTTITGSDWAVTVYPFNTVDVGYVESNKRIYLYGTGETAYWYSALYETNKNNIKIGTSSTATHACYSSSVKGPPLLYTNDIKFLTYSSDKVYWDETSYFYKVPTEPETPTMPSNSEIASAVQMFYNSVYNLPNIGFKDFVVLYDNTTGLYSYIGHNRDNSLGQVIVEPNGYYEGYKFDSQWWKFYLENSEDEWWFENIEGYFSYFVYTSDGTIENLNYVGKSNISGLIEKSGPWATSNTVIVYSTNDYPVKYVTFSEDSPDPVVQTGTIQGDQYTYDENLDITDNQYNPLDNFISINYPSTLVGNADFDSFLNTFNENKDVLVLPQNANWVILANTSLFSYFGSFIIMCTLFIIIERIMRG